MHPPARRWKAAGSGARPRAVTHDVLTKRSRYDLRVVQMVNTKIVRLDDASEGARARILRAGLALFSAKGFDGSGLRELAAEAGVNHSLVLYHFGSMDGLWKAVVGALLEEFQRRVQQRLAGLSTIDPVTQLKITIEDFIRFSMEKPELHRLMTLEGRRRTPRLTWLVETYLQPQFEQGSALIARGPAAA